MNQLFSSEMDIHAIYEFCENHLNRLKLFTLLAGTSIAATGVRTRIVIAMVAHKWSLIRHWTDLSTNWWERRTNPARYMLCGFPYLDRWPNWNPPLELASFVTDMQPPTHTRMYGMRSMDTDTNTNTDTDADADAEYGAWTRASSICPNGQIEAFKFCGTRVLIQVLYAPNLAQWSSL